MRRLRPGPLALIGLLSWSLACTCGNLPLHTTVEVFDPQGQRVGEGAGLDDGLALDTACAEACAALGAEDDAACVAGCRAGEGSLRVVRTDSHLWGVVHASINGWIGRLIRSLL